MRQKIILKRSKIGRDELEEIDSKKVSGKNLEHDHGTRIIEMMERQSIGIYIHQIHADGSRDELDDEHDYTECLVGIVFFFDPIFGEVVLDRFGEAEVIYCCEDRNEREYTIIESYFIERQFVRDERFYQISYGYRESDKKIDPKRLLE